MTERPPDDKTTGNPMPGKLNPGDAETSQDTVEDSDSAVSGAIGGSGNTPPALISPNDGPIRLREMNAFLLLDDEIYARANVDDDGNFVFNDIEPNVYGFATASRDGFAAPSFQAIAADEEIHLSANRPNNLFQNVTIRRPATVDSLHVAICPPDDLPYLRTRLETLTGSHEFDEFVWVADAPRAGGFGFSSGAISGGVFNSGDLIGAGLGIWLVSEILDEDDREPVLTPPPVSPFLYIRDDCGNL